MEGICYTSIILCKWWIRNNGWINLKGQIEKVKWNEGINRKKTKNNLIELIKLENKKCKDL
jgi:hypothetical protein